MSKLVRSALATLVLFIISGNRSQAQEGQPDEIGTSYSANPTGASYTVTMAGTINVPQGSTGLAGSGQFKVGGYPPGAVTFTFLRTFNGRDIYEVYSSITPVTSGVYGTSITYSFTAPGAPTKTTITDQLGTISPP